MKADRRAGKDRREFTASERLLLVSSLILICLVAVVGRLGYLQLVCHTEYLARAARQQQRIMDITPKRGSIYDRNLDPLAMSIPVDSVFAVPIEVADVQLAAQLLSRVLGIPSEVLEAKLASAQSFAWIARKVPPDKKEAVEALNLKGIYFQKENQRIYPKRDLAAHVLGFVDLDEKGRALEGILGVQVHVGPAMEIQYRNSFLLDLPDDLPLITAEQAKIPASAVKVVPQGQSKKK